MGKAAEHPTYHSHQQAAVLMCQTTTSAVCLGRVVVAFVALKFDKIQPLRLVCSTVGHVMCIPERLSAWSLSPSLNILACTTLADNACLRQSRGGRIAVNFSNEHSLFLNDVQIAC